MCNPDVDYKSAKNDSFLTNLPPRNKKKPPGKSFLFPKQFDHRHHVHLCVLPHHVQDLFWWADDGYFNVVLTYICGVLMDISILIGPILMGCWWIFQFCLDLFWWAVGGYFNVVWTLIFIKGFFDQYDDYGDEDIEKKKNYFVMIGHVK